LAGFSDQWWYARRKELMAVAATKCPVFVYNEESLNDILFDLLSLDTIDALFYPVRINPHPKILRKVFEMGGGFRCISSDELDRLFALFPEINPETVLFTSETATCEGVALAFHYGTHVLVHDIKMILDNPRIFQERELFVTLAPDNGEESSVQIINEILVPFQITLAGFFIESGGHLDTNIRLPGLTEALGTSSKGPTVILGGESGVVLNPEKDTVDIAATRERLDVIKETYPGFSLWLEPGSGVVSGAGVLLSRVVASNEKDGIYTARIEMPADPPLEAPFPGTPHHTVNLSRMQEETSPLTMISGQEAGRPVPMEEGDILLFTNMGAFRSEKMFQKGRQGVPEHYLHARKICPVKI